MHAHVQRKDGGRQGADPRGWGDGVLLKIEGGGQRDKRTEGGEMKHNMDGLQKRSHRQEAIGTERAIEDRALWTSLIHGVLRS